MRSGRLEQQVEMLTGAQYQGLLLSWLVALTAALLVALIEAASIHEKGLQLQQRVAVPVSVAPA
jgi:hypothetical protein